MYNGCSASIWPKRRSHWRTQNELRAGWSILEAHMHVHRQICTSGAKRTKLRYTRANRIQRPVILARYRFFGQSFSLRMYVCGYVCMYPFMYVHMLNVFAWFVSLACMITNLILWRVIIHVHMFLSKVTTCWKSPGHACVKYLWAVCVTLMCVGEAFPLCVCARTNFSCACMYCICPVYVYVIRSLCVNCTRDLSVFEKVNHAHIHGTNYATAIAFFYAAKTHFKEIWRHEFKEIWRRVVHHCVCNVHTSALRRLCLPLVLSRPAMSRLNPAPWPCTRVPFMARHSLGIHLIVYFMHGHSLCTWYVTIHTPSCIFPPPLIFVPYVFETYFIQNHAGIALQSNIPRGYARAKLQHSASLLRQCTYPSLCGQKA